MIAVPSVSSTSLLCLLLFGNACATSAHSVRGTVVKVDQGEVAVRHKSGRVVYMSLTPLTAYRWENAASLHNLSRGARVIVTLDRGHGPFTATEIRVFTSPAIGIDP